MDLPHIEVDHTLQQECEGHKLPTISADVLLKWFKMFILGSNL